MKRFASVLLAVVLILSLSVFAFADSFYDSVYYVELTEHYSLDDVVIPYSLLPINTDLHYNNGAAGSIYSGAMASTGVAVESGDYLVGSGWTLNGGGGLSSLLQNGKLLGSSSIYPSGTSYWWFNQIIRITDANGYVLQPSDFDKLLIFSCPQNKFDSSFYRSGNTDVVIGGNIYGFEDGFMQVALSTDNNSSFWGVGLGMNLSSSSNAVAPFSFEVEVWDFYNNESSSSVPPFVVGSGAHSTTPPTPEVKDPNDHTQYGSASDQVEWYNDAYGAAVDPELEDKMSDATDMILQQEEIESEVIDGLNQYSSQVDPANLSFPTQILNGLSFIGTTFMGSYNALGDIGFVISLSMMLGVVLVIIGRGEGALARGMSASARERRRTEYSSQRDMNKGG